MTLKRTISYILILFFVFVIALFIAWASISFILPQSLQSRIISEIRTATGLSDFTMQVRELDLEGADFGEVRVGAAAQPALIVRSIQVDYTAAGLLQKKIKKVTASGIELYCELKNGKLGFRGVDLESFIQRLQSRMGAAPDSSGAESLLALEQLVLRNVTLNIQINSRTFRISGDIDIFPEKMAFDRITSTALIYTRGHTMTLTADVDLDHKSNFLKFSAQNVVLDRFADLTGKIDGVNISGRANIDAAAKLTWGPLKISELAASIEINEIKMDVPGYQFQNPVNPDKETRPWRINLEAINASEWMISTSEITAVGPIPLDLSKMNFRLKWAEGGLQGSGNISISPAGEGRWPPNSLPITVSEQFPLRIHYTLQYSKEGALSFGLKNQLAKHEASKSGKLKFEQNIITARPPLINISGNVNKNGAAASYQISIPDVEIASDMARLKFPDVILSGTATMNHQPRVNPSVTFNLQLPGSVMTVPSAEFRIPSLTLSGHIVQNKMEKQMVKALLRWDDSSMMFRAKDATISAVKGQVPIQWPVYGKVQHGSFSAGKLQYQDTNVGSVRGIIQQTAQGFEFNGEHDNELIPELKLRFRGTTKLFQSKIPETRIHFQLLTPGAGTQISLEKLLPQAKGVIVNGKLSLDGNLVFSKLGMSGSLSSGIDQANVKMPQKKISIEGIQVKFSIPELSNLRSAPQQHLRFDRAAIGDLEVRDGAIEFQIESLQSVFIEKSQFKWVDGNVDTYAIRISPGIEDYRLILYCDRVNLAKVLQQLGVAKVEAEGELNGRIPLQYQNGKLRIDDGFLFSSPGLPRKIRMANADLLTTGIPAGTPQYIQMELARKALEDYDYAWVKFNINSEDEDLIIRMQLDGKPANPLPFVYRKDLGRFVKIEAEGQGSIFQGIRLDVNFRLPFNKLLQYREILKMIQ